jgi:hypothetical protein
LRQKNLLGMEEYKEKAKDILGKKRVLDSGSC